MTPITPILGSTKRNESLPVWKHLLRHEVLLTLPIYIYIVLTNFIDTFAIVIIEQE